MRRRCRAVAHLTSEASTEQTHAPLFSDVKVGISTCVCVRACVCACGVILRVQRRGILCPWLTAWRSVRCLAC
jgi:hypothetical protein